MTFSSISMKAHHMEMAQQQKWRSGYGDSSEPDGMRSFLLCSCGVWREFNGDFATARTEHEAEVERENRGYDLVSEFFICRFDRTVTDSMDGHDVICTRPKETK